MTKKNTRSCSHKHVKAALCAAMCSVLTAMPTFAAGEDNSAATTGTTVWTKASEIMQDVYSQIISISTVTSFCEQGSGYGFQVPPWKNGDVGHDEAETIQNRPGDGLWAF